MENVVTKARGRFEAHIAKACHHGSHHFTTEFLRSVNAIATVISSGDNESYAHPRPDALGALGKYGRGERPLIFSTELARSYNESSENPFVVQKEIKQLFEKIEQEPNAEKRNAIRKKLDKKLKTIERAVAVYGMINVRTDGEKVIICQKLEKPRSKAEKWDIHELIYNVHKNDFEYKIKLNH